MAASLESKLARLPGGRRARVHIRAAELIAEEILSNCARDQGAASGMSQLAEIPMIV
jgi:hypothetical protein